MSTTPETPTTVEVGQMWRDNDQRTKSSGEFTVVAILHSEHGDATYLPGGGEEFQARVSGVARRVALRAAVFPVAIVRRESGRLTRIRVERLLNDRTKRGYTYLGRER